MPLIDVFHHLQPALVVERSGKLRKPGTQPLSNTISYPNAHLGFGLDGILPTIRFFQPDTEDAANRFATQGSPVFLGATSIRPWCGQSSPSLMVDEQNVSQLTSHFEVGKSVRYETRLGVDLADLTVPEPGELCEALQPPD